MVPDRFRLKRYFSIASLIGVLVAVTALSLLYRVTARQALVEHETQSNVALTRAVSNTLLPRYMAWLAGAGALSREALAADPQLRQLDRDIRDQIRGLNVVKAKIFLPSGSTVYSTDLGELGRQTASLGFSRALGGEVSSELSFRDEYYALEGLTALVDTISRVARAANPSLRVEGILRTMYDARNSLTGEVSDQLHHYFGKRVYQTVIPRNVRLAEAPSHGQSVLEYDRYSRGAVAYLALASEILRRRSAEQAR